MLKKHHQSLVATLIIADVLIAVGSWLLAYYLRLKINYPSKVSNMASFKEYLWALYLIVPLHLISFRICNMYIPRRSRTSFSETLDIIRSEVFAYALIGFGLFFVRHSSYSRAVLIYGFFLTVFSLFISRMTIRSILHWLRSKGWNLRFALIVGSGKLGQEVLEVIERNPAWGIRVKGYIDDTSERQGKEYHGVSVIGTTHDISPIINEQDIDQVFIALPFDKNDRLRNVVDNLGEEMVNVRIIPDLRHFAPLNPHFGDLDGLPVVNIQESPLDAWNSFIKRIFDITFSLFALFLLSVPLLAIAIAIKLTSKGPIFYKQERVGLDGKVFNILKFRSMKINAEAQTGAVWAKEDDPRRTKLGTFLRKTSLDELPQFFNVLKGEMSVVGPRPERPVFIDEFKKTIPKYMLRHKMKAGITGWAQANGWRGNTPLEKRIQYDLYYIENWSIWFDIRIIILTVFTIFSNKNAY